MTREDTHHQEDVAHPREVRAGPGDAGASERPERLPETPAEVRKGRSATKLLLILVIVGALVALVMRLAAAS